MLGHAVTAAQVALLDHRDAQVGVRPAVAIEEPLRAGRAVLWQAQRAGGQLARASRDHGKAQGIHDTAYNTAGSWPPSNTSSGFVFSTPIRRGSSFSPTSSFIAMRPMRS